jgi:hypothetical protein
MATITKMLLDRSAKSGPSDKAPYQTSPMIRYRIVPLALLAALFAAAPACAQETPINVYFEPLKGDDVVPLYKAIQEALSKPPLQLVAKPFAGVLVITVLGKVDVKHKQVSGTYYDFTVSFSRDGNSLGQSQQACNSANLAECTDQLVQDVKSVTAPR